MIVCLPDVALHASHKRASEICCTFGRHITIGMSVVPRYAGELLTKISDSPSTLDVTEVRERLIKVLGASASQEEHLFMDLLARMLR